MQSIDSFRPAVGHSDQPALVIGDSSTATAKIVIVIARLIIGGPTEHVMLLNTRLDPASFQSVLVCGRGNPGEADLLDRARAQNLCIAEIPEIVGEANFGLRDVIAIWKLYRILRRERAAIVHTHTAKAGFVGRIAGWLARTPTVIHTYHGHVLRGYYSPLKTRLLRWLETLLARVCRVIVVVSPMVGDELVNLGVVSRSKVRVIPLGIELDRYLTCDSLRGAFHAELRLPPDARLVAVVGRIAPIKNHDLFLDAAKRVLAAIPNAYFLVIGDGLGRPVLEQRAHTLGIASNVIFTGWRLDLARVYADLDVLVVSSINEGTPVSAIEALAAGCPVVATSVGGVPDVITDGIHGYLVPSRDVDAMADRIVTLLRDPAQRRAMGCAGREMAAARFRADRLIRDIESLYRELLEDV